MTKKFLMYSRRFIEDPDQVYEWKTFDLFTKIHWRSWIIWWIKNVWYIHKDLLKILIKFMNENFLMYSRRFLEDPNQVYQRKIFDVFTKIHWRPWKSLQMKNFCCIHEDLLKTLKKVINGNFLMYSRRFIEDPDKVYQ